MNSHLPQNRELNRKIGIWNGVYWSFLALYIIAFFLPSVDNASDDLFGWQCASASILFGVVGIVAPPGGDFEILLQIWIGNLANLSVLLTLICHRRTLGRIRHTIDKPWLFLIMSIIGSFVWLFLGGKSGVGEVMIGYWVWVCGVNGMAISHLLYRNAVQQETVHMSEEAGES